MSAQVPTIRLLLLEDNPTDEFLFKASISKVRDIHFEVLTAVRMETALELLRERSVDVIITDLNLPDSAGSDTVKRLSRQAGMAPIIALTGWEDPALGARLIEDGAFAYWSKNRISGPDFPAAIVHAINSSHSRHG